MKNNNEHRVSLENAKMTPRKAMALREPIINKKASDAISQLKFAVDTGHAKVIAKLIASGVAGLKLKDKEATDENIYISRYFVNEGTKMKRQFSKSRGRTTPFIKRRSRINIYLIRKNDPSIPLRGTQGDFSEKNHGSKS